MQAEVQLRLRQVLSDTCTVSRRRTAKMPRTKLADYARWFATRGGKVRAKALTAAELRAIGKQGAEARWAKKRKRPA